MAWEKHSLSSPRRLPGARLSVSMLFGPLVVMGQGGQRPTPSQSLAAGTEKAVVSLVPGAEAAGPAQMLLRSLSLVRAPSSLRCPACGGGHWMPPKAASALPAPALAIPQPCIFTAAQGRCIVFRGWKREGNAKGPGAGAKQILPCWLLPHTIT